MQINNIKIKFNKTYNKYQCISPHKIVLEEFSTIEEARQSCRSIKDFKKIGGQQNEIQRNNTGN